jgi:hypothetical protein
MFDNRTSFQRLDDVTLPQTYTPPRTPLDPASSAPDDRAVPAPNDLTTPPPFKDPAYARALREPARTHPHTHARPSIARCAILLPTEPLAQSVQQCGASSFLSRSFPRAVDRGAFSPPLVPGAFLPTLTFCQRLTVQRPSSPSPPCPPITSAPTTPH